MEGTNTNNRFFIQLFDIENTACTPKIATEYNLTIYENEFAPHQDLALSILTPLAAPSQPPNNPPLSILSETSLRYDRGPEDAKNRQSPCKPHGNPMYQEAIQGPGKGQWIKAMNDEIRSIEPNQTLRLINLPTWQKGHWDQMGSHR